MMKTVKESDSDEHLRNQRLHILADIDESFSLDFPTVYSHAKFACFSITY